MKTTVKVMALCMLGMVLLGGSAMAASTFNIGGIKVSISPGGNAYYDEMDGTLTVVPYYNECTIKITCTSDAVYYWGGYCDVFIAGMDVVFKSVSMKGKQTMFYVTGQTYHVYSFNSTYTCIGGTDYWGPDMGLGMTSSQLEDWPWPKAISMKTGVCWAPMLAWQQYDRRGKAVDVDGAASRKMLSGR